MKNIKRYKGGIITSNIKPFILSEGEPMISRNKLRKISKKNNIVIIKVFDVKNFRKNITKYRKEIFCNLKIPIKYPKYSKDQNLSCKLNEEDIAYIRYRYKSGDSITKLAEIFDVTYSTIKYWVDEDFRQKQLIRPKVYQKNKIINSKQHFKYIQRKLKIQPILREYLLEKDRQYRKTHREQQRVHARQYRKTHLEQRKIYDREYHKIHRTQILARQRQYRKTHREQLLFRRREKYKKTGGRARLS